MALTPPFGYRDVVPFERDGRVRLPAAGECPAAFRGVNALPLSFTEFPRAAFHYPIVFVADGAGAFMPAAVLGLQPDSNLFVEASGRWTAGAYVPAYARRYPFCTAPARGSTERVVCVERSEIDPAGEPLFDAAGNVLPRWSEYEGLLREYDGDAERTREFCALLAKLRLLTPFSAQAVAADGRPWHLDGMQRVDERKLEFLSHGQYKTLVRTGGMGRIYTHLLSLDNFGRLLDRQAAFDQT